MPRLARLDAPGFLHHIIIQENKYYNLFRANKDRDSFIDCLSDFGKKVSEFYQILAKRFQNHERVIFHM